MCRQNEKEGRYQNCIMRWVSTTVLPLTYTLHLSTFGDGTCPTTTARPRPSLSATIRSRGRDSCLCTSRNPRSGIRSPKSGSQFEPSPSLVETRETPVERMDRHCLRHITLKRITRDFFSYLYPVLPPRVRGVGKG